MKKYFSIKLLLLMSIVSFDILAQGDNVGIGTLKPDNSAVLELSSDSKGLLIPRLTISQRDQILSPASGLMIYQVNANPGFYYFDSKSWKPLNSIEAKSVALDIQNWSKTGDAGTNAVSNFLGTTDNVSLAFRANNRQSGFIDVTGQNTHFGYLAGEFSSGIGNTVIGALSYNVGSGSNNTGVGLNALRNTTGDGNVAIGNDALITNSGGNYNMGIGTLALRNNVSGFGNVAIGTQSLMNTTGSNNVGIGFTAGMNATGSRNVFLGYQSGFSETGNDKLYVANSNTITPLIYGDFSAKYVTIGDVTPALRTQGTATGGYNLLVKGGILTEKVKVALAAAGADWADYVFEPAYKANMMSLEEVEAFTLKNKHLPNVPSAEEMVKSGLDVSQTSKMFMEKIEELTLYMIELNKEIKALKEENAKLKK
jgi:hypothetical protein